MRNLQRAVDLYRLLLISREIDRREQVFLSQNLAHFHVSGAGHEASAALAAHLTVDDWLHPHYRDKALLLARGVAIEEFFRSSLGRVGSHSAGRQMSAHFSDPRLNVASLVGPVGNHALQAVGIAAAIKDRAGRPIVVCASGDGTTQQGEFLEAIAEAVRWRLPVLFLVEDNRYSISTPTRGRTFFDRPAGPASQFYGLSISRLDGVDVLAVDEEFGQLVALIRETRGPRLAVLEVERLSDHSNADDQTTYRRSEEIERGRAGSDPLINLERSIIAAGFPASELDQIRDLSREAVRLAAEVALAGGEPSPSLAAKAPFPPGFLARPEYRGDPSTARLTMRGAIADVLRARLETDLRVFLYGQDIEDPKGDVFGVTKGLSTAFPGRVVNAPLSESTIVGTSIGRAMAGQRPVAFLQFADFLPLAFNQIASELGSLHWRTDGGWQCPVVVMVTCGGYKPGLGPFHAQTMEGFAAHVPGVDVVMPSSAADAAGLLNAALDSPRPTIFFYPKSCLNRPDRATSDDVAGQFVPPGKARRIAAGTDLTLVTWGNPVAQCERAASALADAGFSVDLLDLRSISPWDEAGVLASAGKTGRLVVVHEDNRTCGFGAEVLATVAERSDRPVKMRRVARLDTFIPYHFGNQLEVLPSYRQVLETCADLLGCDVAWTAPPADPPGRATIRAIGSGPADEAVDVVKILVREADEVRAGQVVAEIEASKSVVAVCATADGRVEAIVATEGDRVPVGSALIRLATGATTVEEAPILTEESPGIPRLTRRAAPIAWPNALNSEDRFDGVIHASRPSCVVGGRVVSSETLAANIPGWTVEEVVKRTGVASRCWTAEGEDVVSLAIRASEQLFGSIDPGHPPITAVICSTTTPRESSPSVACQVATSLRDRGVLGVDPLAFDFNAACSGYMYGLRLAADLLRGDPAGAVLLVTSEIASPMLDPSDPSTVFLFGDAASATLVTAKGAGDGLLVRPPICLASADPDISIHLPCLGTSRFLRMNGIAVARTAYKAMANAVRSAVAREGIGLDGVAALIPHPGSKRILQNVAEHLEFDHSKVLTTLADTGNTSSSSIPLALDRFWDQLPRDQPLALTAFGAGFTTAATTAKRIGGNA